jgi:hypothetical protein
MPFSLALSESSGGGGGVCPHVSSSSFFTEFRWNYFFILALKMFDLWFSMEGKSNSVCILWRNLFLDCIAPSESWIEKDVEGSGCDLIWRCYPGISRGGDPQPVSLCPGWPRFEQGISHIQVRSVGTGVNLLDTCKYQDVWIWFVTSSRVAYIAVY